MPSNRITPFEDYGAVGDNSTDCTPALAKALAAGESHLWLWPGKSYRFNTKPPALNGIYLHGGGISRTAIVKAWSSTYYGDALLDFVGNAANGGGAENMSIVANDSTGGTLLRVISTLGSPVSYTTFSNLVFTYSAGASYDRAILIDGSQGLAPPQGVRDTCLTNIYAFRPGVAPYTIEVINAVNLMGTNVWTNGSVRVGGMGVQNGDSNSIAFSNLIAGISVDVDHVNGISISGQVPTLNVSATAVNGTFKGVRSTVNNASQSFTA